MTDKPERPRDGNRLAHMIVGIATGEEDDYGPDTSAQRKGGLKGGEGRASSLAPKQREEMAKLAADARRKKDQAASSPPNLRSSMSSLKSKSI